MDIKAFFTDIDGTLLNSNRDLSENTVKQIQRIKEKMPVVLVSARMPKQMRHLQTELQITKEPLICYNGGLILVDNKPIHSTEIPHDFMEYLVDFNENISKEKFHISFFNNDQWYVEQMDYWAKREENNTKVTPELKPNKEVVALWKKQNIGAHKITCMGDAQIIEEAFAHLTEKFGDTLHLYRSKDTYIEIANKAVSKLTAIEKLLDNHLHVPLENVIAFGDNYNDTEMIHAVGHGVAVENAREEVKKVANAITDHHKQDGVANYIEKHL